MVRTLRRWLGMALLAAAPQAIAAPCTPGTLADYIALASGCEIGATTFAGFATLPDLPAGSTPIPSTAITVTPLASAGNPGFVFGLDATATTPELLSALIQFQVLAATGATLTGASAAIAGASATGDGVALLVEDLCIGGLFATPPSGCAGTPLALVNFADAGSALTSDSLAFAAATLLDIAVNFIIDGGLAGSATLGSGTVRFVTDATPTPVDEPGALALAIAALATFATARSRRRSPR